MRDVMLDLETMGTGPTAAIVAIGAVQFDPDAGTLSDEFYATVDLASSVAAGLQMEPDTVLWWLRQSAEAQRAIANNSQPLADALQEFARRLPGCARVWGNGAAFDNVILANAYRTVGVRAPWDFRDDRCYRTLRALYPDVLCEYDGTAHHALDDARNQARHALAIFDTMRARTATEETR